MRPDLLVRILRHIPETEPEYAEVKSLIEQESRMAVKIGPSEAQMHQEFEDWWDKWPRKDGKIPARKSFYKCRKSGISVERINIGSSRYCAGRKVDEFFLMPATFLNQGRFDDAGLPNILTGIEAHKADLLKRVNDERSGASERGGDYSHARTLLDGPEARR